MALTSHVWAMTPPKRLPKDVVRLTKKATQRLKSHKVSSNHRRERVGKLNGWTGLNDALRIAGLKRASKKAQTKPVQTEPQTSGVKYESYYMALKSQGVINE